MDIAMVHNNPASLNNGMLTVDRKFHVGMERYAASINAPLLALNPRLQDGQQIMDAVTIPVAKLPYKIETLLTDHMQCVVPADIARQRELIKSSRLVYGGGMNCARVARQCGVPYIMILEYDLATQMTVTASEAPGLARGIRRRLHCALKYFGEIVPDMRHAHSLHCNGYPVYEAAKPHNRNRLLYLDSRMSADMLISEAELRERLARRTARPLRLLYSGRYEALKGALDAVKVARECLKLGMDVEMHCYGQGRLKAAMRELAAGYPITIHDAIAYPDLVQISRTFDVFVCCHIQGDPSCTYLESFGAGLPIAGYANRMWRGLCAESKAGFGSSIGSPGKVALSIQSMMKPGLLETLSLRALDFAKRHRFEIEFQKRVSAINAAADDITHVGSVLA